MNRVNFARHSGVVLDVCKAHGTWFDVTELQRMIAFIQGGGLDSARNKDRERLAEERRRLEMLQTYGERPDHTRVSMARDTANSSSIELIVRRLFELDV